MRPEKVTEQIKDRQDYRQALIHKRNGIDAKIEATEKQIAKLKEK